MRPKHLFPASFTQRPANAARVVAVLGGIGGVGKSTVALNVAVALSCRGERVLLIDGGSGLSNFDFRVRSGLLTSVVDLPGDADEISRFVVDGPGGLSIIGGVADHEITDSLDSVARSFQRAVATLRTQFGSIVIDCGTGVTPAIVSQALESDVAVLVSTTDASSLANTYAVAKVLSQRGFAGRIGLVLNMFRLMHDARCVARRFRRTASRFLGREIEEMGLVPYEKRVVRADRLREPLVLMSPTNAASACLCEICDRLDGRAPPAADAGGIWTRMAGIFL